MNVSLRLAHPYGGSFRRSRKRRVRLARSRA